MDNLAVDMSNMHDDWELPSLVAEKSHLKDILYRAVQLGASDISIQTERPIMMDINGSLRQLAPRLISDFEMGNIIEFVYGSSDAVTELRSGKDIDQSFEMKMDEKWFRFRYNATACIARSYNSAMQVTLRVLPNTPPTLESMDLPDELRDALLPSDGMVLVTGATGSGKSTLLASIVREYLMGEVGKKIITYESPIEFTYDECENVSSMVAQSSVPFNLTDYAKCVRNAMRRKPDVILLGEARDSETVRALVEAAMTGHVCYSTVHASNVAVTMRRMLNCAGDAVSGADIIENTRVIISQRLLRNPRGGRTAVRDALVFTDTLRQRLINTEIDKLTSAIHDMVLEFGYPMLDDIRRKHREGRIYEQDIIVAEKYAGVPVVQAGDNISTLGTVVSGGAPQDMTS